MMGEIKKLRYEVHEHGLLYIVLCVYESPMYRDFKDMMPNTEKEYSSEDSRWDDEGKAYSHCNILNAALIK